MGQVLIRNLDDAVVESLKARAAREEKSLEQFLREILTQAVRPSREEALATLDQFHQTIRMGPGAPPPEEVIRQVREARDGDLERASLGTNSN